MTTVLLVRHGQTEWNRVERFRGRFDIPLNKTGLEQAEKTAREITRRWNPDAIYASPLARALQTAQKIKDLCEKPVQQSKGLVDIDYGDWQGLTYEEAGKQWSDLISDWFEHPEKVQIPGGENLAQVRNRARLTLDQICSQHVDQTIVLVSHTVVNRLMLLEILGLGNEKFWDLRQEPCTINLLEKSRYKYTIVTLNDFHHLV